MKTVLDFQDPFDGCGYDIFKAFGLMEKSNPGIYEWVYSPVIYHEADGFSARLKKVIETNYSPYSLFKHYGSLCKRNVGGLCKGSYSFKKQKQLLQALRAELIRIGIIHRKSVESPFQFIEIAGGYVPELYRAYLGISDAKRQNKLLAPSEAFAIIQLLQSSIQKNDEHKDIPRLAPSPELLDKWIWEIFDI